MKKDRWIGMLIVLASFGFVFLAAFIWTFAEKGAGVLHRIPVRPLNPYYLYLWKK